MPRENPRLTLGDSAPPFTLPTSAGQDTRLTDALSSSALILVFIRGTW
jgi:peroxiredoxin